MLDAVERQHGAAGLAALRARLPPRLHPYVSLDRLRASAVLDSIALDDGDEVLLAVDAVLGDGSGKVLENIGAELASRALGQAGGVVRHGDLFGTVARLQAFLEHPFVDAPLSFEMSRIEGGFKMTCSVAGRSRSTKIVRSLAAGAISAAERFARETTGGEVSVSIEGIADRATITARYQGRESQSSEQAPVSRRRSSVRPPAPSITPGTLSQEVEKILSSAGVSGERRPSTMLRRPSDSALAAQALKLDEEAQNGPQSSKRSKG